MTKENDLEAMSECDLLHYKREKRKFAYDNFERYKRMDEKLTFKKYLIHVYPVIEPKFHEQYMKRHLTAREYLATGFRE